MVTFRSDLMPSGRQSVNYMGFVEAEVDNGQMRWIFY